MPVNLKSQRYVVAAGDSLSSIAQRRGYADWRVIFFSRCNDSLRRQRANPDLIRPGDVIMLPPTAAEIRQVVDGRLKSLQQIRQGTEAMYAEAEKRENEGFAAVKRLGFQVDTVKMVVDIFTGIGTVLVKGAQAMGKAGAALAKANKDLAHEAIRMPRDQIQGVVLQAYAGSLRPEMGLCYAIPMIIVQSWLDMTSPSYWANVYVQLRSGASWSKAVTTTLDDVHADAIATLRAQKSDALRAVDRNISDARRLMMTIGQTISKPLPL